jgi:enamine deaminase RidA (YjgF/YER057c/UK114 family)
LNERPVGRNIVSERMIARYESNSRLSKAVVANGFVFLSGITAEDVSGDIEAQTKSVLKQIDAYLAQAGTSKTRLVSMNKVWESWIGRENTPARATVESQLATPAILVEIMVQATL